MTACRGPSLCRQNISNNSPIISIAPRPLTRRTLSGPLLAQQQARINLGVNIAAAHHTTDGFSCKFFRIGVQGSDGKRAGRFCFQVCQAEERAKAFDDSGLRDFNNLVQPGLKNFPVAVANAKCSGAISNGLRLLSFETIRPSRKDRAASLAISGSAPITGTVFFAS